MKLSITIVNYKNGATRADYPWDIGDSVMQLIEKSQQSDLNEYKLSATFLCVCVCVYTHTLTFTVFQGFKKPLILYLFNIS